MNLYYDTILKLYERGYLFEDDPELDEIRVLLAQGGAQSSTDAAGAVSISVFPDSNLSQRLTTRNRVIFPYLRRLLETQKAAMVTKRRVDFLNEQIQPDDEIRRVFQEKFDDAMRVGDRDVIDCSKTPIIRSMWLQMSCVRIVSSLLSTI